MGISLISKEEILDLKGKLPEADTEICNRVIEFVFKDGHEKQLVNLQSLKIGYQTIYATTVGEGEIFNGGFGQYFDQTSPEERTMIIDGFLRIGATKIGALLKSVSDGSDLDDASSLFYKITQEEHPNELRNKYIFSHLEEF